MKNFLTGLLAFALVSCGGGGGTSQPSPPPTPPPAPVSVSISPTTATAGVGSTVQFTSTVSNTANTAVNWQVNDVAGGNSTVGTISASGLYTAPADVPSPNTVTVKAVSQADVTKSASATATIVFSNTSLNGSYAFSFSGSDSLGGFFAAGTFQADGNGNLLNGVEDINHATGVFTNVLFSGSYSVGQDGRGTATITSSQGTSNFRFVVISSNFAQLIAFGSTDSGSGSITKQDQTAFVTSALNGNYVFGIDGFSTSGSVSSIAGRFTADGSGGISAGVLDINDGGSISNNVPFSASYSVASNGRGNLVFTSSLGTFQFAFYVISANQIRLISLDFLPAFFGLAEKQDGATFSIASLSGDYVFLESGFTTLGLAFTTGRLTTDGAGVITSGVFDENDTGFVSENVAFTGSYTVSANGRGTASLTSSLGTSTFAFYLESPTAGFFVGTDSFAVNSGGIVAQQGAPFSNSSVSGSYGFAIGGITTLGLINIVGQLQADGAGITTGTEDVNEAGALSSVVSLTGTYTISANGRGVATVTPTGGPPSNLRFYLVSGSGIAIIGVDSTALLIGAAGKQF